MQKRVHTLRGDPGWSLLISEAPVYPGLTKGTQPHMGLSSCQEKEWPAPPRAPPTWLREPQPQGPRHWSSKREVKKGRLKMAPWDGVLFLHKRVLEAVSLHMGLTGSWERDWVTCSTERTASIAKGASIETAGGAKKPLLQDPRCWILGHVVRQGAGMEGHCKAGPSLELHCCKRQAGTVSVTIWCLGDSSHSGNGNGNKERSGNSNARGCMVRVIRW